MYVWFDALLNYITALDWEHDGERFKTFWPANVQLIGREIARFHTIIWPATLWALGLQEPQLVYAHGWITVEGEKMSKSKGNVIDPFEAAAELGADSIRYFFMREAPFGNDFSISRDKFRHRHNGDLGNDLGNLLRRSLAMLARYRESIVPAAVESAFARAFRRTRRRRAGAHLRARLPRRAGSHLGARHRAESLDRGTQAVGSF